MGGYSTITQSPEEFPQEISNQMRRRGLIPALMQTQPAQAAGTDRVADDPVTRPNPEAYGATTPAQSPTSTSPTNPLTEKMWEEYNKLGQPEPAPAPPSLKDRLLRGLLMAAPVAAGALGGGAYGAAGAAQGENQAIQRQQGMRLAQQQMAQQHEQQRNSLRERMLQEILQQQRMQQQEEQANQRNKTLLDAVTQRGQNALAVQGMKGEQGTALQTQKAGDASALATQKAGEKQPSEWDVFMSGEQGKTPQQIVQDYARFKQPPQREPSITVVVPNAAGGGTVERLRPGQQVTPGSMTAQQYGADQQKQGQALQQAQTELRDMESLSKQNTPAANYAFLMKFIGMSYAGLKGARLNRAEIERAASTRGLPDQLQNVYDLYIQRQQLTPQQKRDMLATARSMAANVQGAGRTTTPTGSANDPLGIR